MAEHTPTDIYDELFGDDWGTSWVVKSERTPTAEKAAAVVEKFEGPGDDGAEVSLERARIEWHSNAEGWVLTVDPEGPYEVWQVTQ